MSDQPAHGRQPEPVDSANGMPRAERVETLADGIFSVAMTLLVLDIRLPEGLRFGSDADLLEHFASVTEAFVIYAVSFAVLAMFWVAHDYQFRYVQRVDRQLLWMNIAFLLLTTTVPFTTNLVASHGGLSLPVTLYAANLLLLTVVLLLHAQRLRKHPTLAKELFSPSIANVTVRHLSTLCVIPIMAIVVAQFSPRWAMRMFFLLAVLHFLPRGRAHEASP